MNGINKYLAATPLSVAMLFTGAAQAMQIQQFDRMADRDQHDYINVFVYGAQRVLINEGKAHLAAKIDKLFTTVPAGDKMSLGLNELGSNLDRARVADIQRIQNDPAARRLEVEDAMIVTMRKNGIELPPSFLTVASNFKPKFPPAHN